MRRKKFKRQITTDVVAWFDGACWPNPRGHASCGAVIKRHGVVIHEESKYIGCNDGMSCNVAEYSGAIVVLEYLLTNGIDHAIVFGDSKLVVNQLNRRWRVRDNKQLLKPTLYVPYYEKARELYDKLPNVRFVWIPREQNQEADELSTRCLRERNIEERFLPRRDPKDFYPHIIKKASIKLLRDGELVKEIEPSP